MRAVLIVTALAAALFACSSPEATRVRGERPGADVGNSRGEVRLHSGPSIYYRTPTEGRGIGHAGLMGGALPG